MEYSLAQVTKADREEIYEIKKSSVYPYVKNIWGWDEEYQQIDFDASFIPKNFQWIIANNLHAGFVEVQETQEKLSIVEIHILPDYQGLGMGSSIIRGIMDDARYKGKAVSLGCFKENVGAKRLYLKLGFDLIKETETHFIFEIK